MTTEDIQTDPRTVDRFGAVVGSSPLPGLAGARPGIGGLGSVVGHPDDPSKVSVVVGLETTPDSDGLLLHLVVVPDVRPGQRVTHATRARATRAYEEGEATAVVVPAAGLITLDEGLIAPHPVL